MQEKLENRNFVDAQTRFDKFFLCLAFDTFRNVYFKLFNFKLALSNTNSDLKFDVYSRLFFHEIIYVKIQQNQFNTLIFF